MGAFISIPCKFENPHDSHDSEHLDNPPHVIEGGSLLLVRRECGARARGGGHRAGAGVRLLAHDEEGDVVGHDGQHVYHVHGTFHEFPFLWSSSKPLKINAIITFTEHSKLSGTKP